MSRNIDGEVDESKLDKAQRLDTMKSTPTNRKQNVNDIRKPPRVRHVSRCRAC